MTPSNTPDTDANDWGVLYRITTDDGETRRLRLRLRDVFTGRAASASTATD